MSGTLPSHLNSLRQEKLVTLRTTPNSQVPTDGWREGGRPVHS